MIHALIKLFSGYGLGDGVQASAILRHLRKHRPNWIIDYQADVGKHSAAYGIVRNAFTYADPLPCSDYDREIEVKLYDTFLAFTDRPNTRVTSCLHERFGMAWDETCGRYEINITEKARLQAANMLGIIGAQKFSIMNKMMLKGGFPIVGIQCEGDSSPDKKNLTTHQAAEICDAVLSLDRIPLLLDWRNKSKLPDQRWIHTTGRFACSDEWGRDAQMNAAIISQCEAFVGIDSGPGKCAGATETPTLICWHGHSPVLFHDPAPNTTHLVPSNHREMDLLRGNAAVADWFESNYFWRTYQDQGDLVRSVKAWLGEVFS